MKPWVKALVAGLAIGLLALQIGRVAAAPRERQLDFKTYYFAAKALALGTSPYDLDNLTKIAGEPVHLRLVYPPQALVFFRPFTLLSYPAACQAYLFLKVALLAALMWFWTRGFLDGAWDPLFWLFALLSFHGAVWGDLEIGNVSIVEQGVLWAGFLCFVRKRPLAFTACVVASSMFRLVPIAFLVLLLFSRMKRRAAYLIAGAAAFCAIVAAQCALQPDLVRDFLGSLRVVEERGIHLNVSSLAFAQDSLYVLGRLTGHAAPSGADWCLYACISAAVLGATLYHWRRAKVGDDERATLLVWVACLVAALVLPRFRTYNCILIILPAWLVIRRMGRDSALAAALFGVLAVLSDTTPLTARSWVGQTAGLLWSLFWFYYPLLIAAGAWAFTLYYLRRDYGVPPPQAPPDAPR